jgi:hypothetical protein
LTLACEKKRKEISIDLNNLTKDEAMAIINSEGEGRQFTARLEAGDPQIKSAVDGAFQRADPERHAIIKAQSGDPAAEKKSRPSEYVKTLDKQFARWQAEQNQNAETSSADPSTAEGTQDATRGESQPFSSEPSAVDVEVGNLLSERWGQDHGENLAKAGEMLRSIFPTVEAMVEFGRKHGLHADPQAQAEILDLLASLNKK